MVTIDKLLETLIGNSRGFEVFKNPTKKELSEITSYVKRGTVRAVYNLNDGNLYVWEMGVVHGYVIRDYFLDEEDDLVKIIIEKNTVKFVDATDAKKNMFIEAYNKSDYIRKLFPLVELKINENFIKREKPDESISGDIADAHKTIEFARLDEKMKFPSNKYTVTSNIGGKKLKKEFVPLNISKIKKIKNKRSGKLYIRKGYTDSYFDTRVAAVFEYAAYRVLKEVKKQTNQNVKIPRAFALNLNEKEKQFELLTSINFSSARTLRDLEPTRGGTDDFIDNQMLPVIPILTLLGHFDIHPGNVIVSKSDYYFIDFERAFINTLSPSTEGQTDYIKMMEKSFFNKLEDMLNKSYENPSIKPDKILKKTPLIKFVKNLNELDIKNMALVVYSNLEKIEAYASKLINSSKLKDIDKMEFKQVLHLEMDNVKKSINDNYKFLENQVKKVKSNPNYYRILQDSKKVKEQYEKIVGT